MDREWIDQYNKKCAEFLGCKSKVVALFDEDEDKETIYIEEFSKPTWWNASYNHRYGFVSYQQTKYMLYHSDWNWIMEVIDKIESIKDLTLETCNNWIGEFTIVIRYSSYSSTHYYSIKKPRISEGQDFRSKKEAVIQAINKFIDWYNKQEELFK